MDRNLSQLRTILQDLRKHTSNLNRDLDDGDDREETRTDLALITKGFDELKSTLRNLEKSDVAKLQDELKQLMSGEENLFEYNRDVNNILIEAKKRSEKNAPTQEKIAENLPPQQKDENVGSLFANWQSVLSNVQKWVEQNATQKTRH